MWHSDESGRKRGCPLSAIELAREAAELDVIDEDMWAWPMLRPIAFSTPVSASGRQGFWRWAGEGK
jgi:hypothetical protein